MRLKSAYLAAVGDALRQALERAGRSFMEPTKRIAIRRDSAGVVAVAFEGAFQEAALAEGDIQPSFQRRAGVWSEFQVKDQVLRSQEQTIPVNLMADRLAEGGIRIRPPNLTGPGRVDVEIEVEPWLVQTAAP